MITVNLSEGKEYHTQRNNEIMPGATCGPTSGTNAILSAEAPFPAPDKKQQEDLITETLMSKEGKAFMKKMFPDGGFNPWNSSECIVWAVNKIAGKTIVEVQKLTLEGIIFNLVKKNPIVMGGAFTKERHFVCTVGFQTEQEDIMSIKSPSEVDLKKLKAMIIDDSWGNYVSDYKSKDGDDTVVPIATYKQIAMDGQRVKTAQVYFHKGIKG